MSMVDGKGIIERVRARGIMERLREAAAEHKAERDRPMSAGEQVLEFIQIQTAAGEEWVTAREIEKATNLPQGTVWLHLNRMVNEYATLERQRGVKGSRGATYFYRLRTEEWRPIAFNEEPAPFLSFLEEIQ